VYSVHTHYAYTPDSPGRSHFSHHSLTRPTHANPHTQTSEDARFYGLSAKLPKSFSNDGKDLVVQYVVKHEQRIDCGGAYIKLLGPGVDQVRRRERERERERERHSVVDRSINRSNAC
jgi:hypothetical protein